MVSKQITVKKAHGLHLRPAGELAELALKFHCKSMLIYKDKEVSAKSLLGVLSLCIRQNMDITVTCDGMNEDEALDAIEKFLSEP